MKIRTCFFFFTLVIILCVSPITADPDDNLSIEVSTDKSTYSIGEHIEMTLEITNTSDHPIKISTLPFTPTIKIADMLKIVSPSGKTLRSMAETGGGRKTQSPPITKLKGGKSLTKTVDLMKLFPEPYESEKPHNFDTPGKYSLTATYQNERGDETVWKGEVSSNQITFKVKPLSPKQIKELKRKLKKGDVSEKSEALNLALKAELELSPDLIQPLLKKENPEALRELAAKAFIPVSDPNMYKLYVKYLGDSNLKVSACMAIILGDLNMKKAVPSLIESAIFKDKPRKYNYAVLRALRKIGDPRAIPAFEQYIEHLESRWKNNPKKKAYEKHKKEFAKEAINELKKAPK